MPAPFLTNDQLRASLAGALQKSDPSLLAVDEQVLTEANTFAGQEILSRMLVRGYTAAQVESWDRLTEYATHLALFWSFTYGGVPYPGYEDRVKDFDRRKELDSEKTILFIGNQPVFPGAAGQSDVGGAVSFGTITAGFTPLEW